jgi:hypothetical protein
MGCDKMTYGYGGGVWMCGLVEVGDAMGSPHQQRGVPVGGAASPAGSGMIRLAIPISYCLAWLLIVTT